MDDPMIQDAFDQFHKDISGAFADIPARREEESQMLIGSIQSIGEQNMAAIQALTEQITSAIQSLAPLLQQIAALNQQTVAELKKPKKNEISDIKTDGEGRVIGATVSTTPVTVQ